MVSVSRFVNGLLLALFFTSATSAEEARTISLPGKQLFPESIAIDSSGGIYLSSVTQAEILYLDPETGQVADFVESGASGLASVGGLQLGPDGKVLYACNSDLGLTAHPVDGRWRARSIGI